MKSCKAKPVQFKKVSWLAKTYNRLNSVGLKKFGKVWLPQYIGAIYPGIIPHFRGNILKSFQKETIEYGEQASTYFEKIGIRDFALQNGGSCTFWMGNKPALYQAVNFALVEDDTLSPSTGPNKQLFGSFMGTYANSDPARKKKRQPLLKLLANPVSLERIIPFIQKNAADFLISRMNKELSLEHFSVDMIAYIDSYAPGVLDLTNKPLTMYLNSAEYGEVMRDFFEFASDVISKMDSKALTLVESITPLIKQIIQENFKSIDEAPESNIIKQYFKLENISFTEDSISNLSGEFLKELGTIIVALYDTTSLSLYWLICYIEQHPEIKKLVIQEAQNEAIVDQLSYIEYAILESIRLAGVNPTALWRQVIKPTQIKLGDTVVQLREETLLWLDRRAANQDKKHFACPHAFKPEHIESISKNKETVFSLLANNRYEINSFSMVNTINNPRKCPGRFFSVFVQSCVVRELYRNYEVNCQGVSTELRKYCSMPRPDNKAKIFFTKKVNE